MHIGYPCIMTSNITFLRLSLSLSLRERFVDILVIQVTDKQVRLSEMTASAEVFFSAVKALVKPKR